jgi:hypothetical protein
MLDRHKTSVLIAMVAVLAVVVLVASIVPARRQHASSRPSRCGSSDDATDWRLSSTILRSLRLTPHCDA